MYTKRIRIANYGPIEQIDIPCPFFDDKPRPVVFVGENGSGKSIVLSHVVNALLCAQQLLYPENPEVQTGKVYKLRSSTYIRPGRQFSWSRVDFEDGLHLDELQLRKTKAEYKEPPPDLPDAAAVRSWNRMPSSDPSHFLPHFDKSRLQEIFSHNCILYFPPNRFEEPAWLNADNLTAQARHTTLKHLAGYNDRNLICHSPLRDNENWLYDVVYDSRVFELQTAPIPIGGPSKSPVSVPVSLGYAGQSTTIYNLALDVVRTVVPGFAVRLGIGRRGHRAISLMEHDRVRVPNVFQLSSGEVALFNLFLSVLRDFDLSDATFRRAEDVRGIVVVDEIDLHLHTHHQHEVLPRLVQMFPRVQFLLTTHLPLFVLGLQHALGADGFGLYRLPDGRAIAAEEFNEFGEAYRAFRNTVAYADDLKAAVLTSSRPLVFVEGATDVKYLQRAVALLNQEEVLRGVDVRESGGDKNLDAAWKALTKGRVARQTVERRPVLLLYDCETNVLDCEDGDVVRRRVPAIENHPIQKGVENLFSRCTLDKARQHKADFIDIVTEHQVTTRGRTETIPESWTVNPDEKTNLCNWLCEHGSAEDFQRFGGVIDVVQEFLTGGKDTATTEDGEHAGREAASV